MIPSGCLDLNSNDIMKIEWNEDKTYHGDTELHMSLIYSSICLRYISAIQTEAVVMEQFSASNNNMAKLHMKRNICPRYHHGVRTSLTQQIFICILVMNLFHYNLQETITSYSTCSQQYSRIQFGSNRNRDLVSSNLIDSMKTKCFNEEVEVMMDHIEVKNINKKNYIIN